MRVIKQGDKIIQRSTSTDWTVVFAHQVQNEIIVDMQANRSGRQTTRTLESLTEYKYVDTNEWVIPRVRSNGWTVEENKYLCKNYKLHGIDRVSNKLCRCKQAVINQMSRLRIAGLVEHYKNM